LRHGVVSKLAKVGGHIAA